MASSRSSAADPLADAVARALVAHLTGPGRVAVALSGGRDSVALLAAAAALPLARVHEPIAIHVHHGLSAHADAWQTGCATLCAELDVSLVTRRVSVDRSDPEGIEAAARRARYTALADAAVEAGASVVLLAHHQDDQAETLLLQLARGAGPHGLAGMPASRVDASGLHWVRPLLGLPRSAIDAWLREHRLPFIDDDSNGERRHRRNALRLSVVPAFARIFPGYPGTLARAADHQAEAARLIDDLAAQDLAPLIAGDGLGVAGLARLPAHRARNVLRHFLRGQGLRPPSTARLAAMLGQLAQVRADAHTEFVHEGVRFGVFRGRMLAHRAPPAAFAQPWNGEPSLAFRHGRLAFVPSVGEGIAAEALAPRRVVVRSRVGGERLALDPARPRRALKSWLHEAGLPPWERAALPLVFCDGTLAAVPGLGVDVDFRASPGKAGYRLDWQPSR
jgi:tRNA(Ile)-lysidine synthase